jgi:aryl-alcohol dehydrogenase-like predicted oxidoreductase
MRQKGLLEKVNRLSSIAQEVGCTTPQLALAYCLQNKQVSSLLFGARKVAQVDDNLRTLEILPRVTPDVMAQIQRLQEAV